MATQNNSINYLNHLRERLQRLHDVMERNHLDRIPSPDGKVFQGNSCLREIDCIIGNVNSVKDEVEKLLKES